MVKRVVISQPMYFPWPGMFEQMKLADVFIHYDDAAFSKGGFLNRVQIKGPQGPVWLTVPLRPAIGTAMNEATLDTHLPWRQKHLRTIAQFLGGQPHAEDALSLAQEVLDAPNDSLAGLNICGMERVASYLSFAPQFMRSSRMQAQGQASERVLRLVQEVGGTHYITGHGAANYLDHALFEAQNIAVEYMDYSKLAYPQKYGNFNPYVTILDTIASLGKRAAAMQEPRTIGWQQFLQERAHERP